jgi:hypothetical protein
MSVRRDGSRFVREWWAYLLIAAAGIVLRVMVPMDIVWGSGHDSQLQVVLARNIANGYWLGGELVADMWIGSQWNLALAKGVGYPLFLVVVKPTGLNPVLAAFLVYLLGAFLVARAVRGWFSNAWGVVMFAALVFSPALYGGEFSRVYRNNLIAALALVALGLSFHLARRLDRARVRVAAGHALGRGDLLLSALLGLCFGLLWITRLDVHWIALGCGAALAVSGWPLLRRVSSTLRIVVPLLAILLASAIVVPLTVSLVNRAQYGIMAADDYGSGPIAETQLLLSRIDAESVHPLVHVNAEQRRKAYAVSPTLARIAGQLEDPASNWKKFPTEVQGTNGESASWFSWELRDAPVRAGLVYTLADLHRFFSAAESELVAACESGRLSCNQRGEFAPGVRFITDVDARQLREQYLLALRVHSRGAGAPNFFNLTPLGIPELDELWTTVVNGVDTKAAPRQMTSPARLFARISVVFVMSVLAAMVLAAVALVARRIRPDWGRCFVGLGCVAGTIVNALIVTWFSIEIGVTTDNNAGYLFAAQSFLYAGLVILLAALAQPLLRGDQRFRRPDVEESS